MPLFHVRYLLCLSLWSTFQAARDVNFNSCDAGKSIESVSQWRIKSTRETAPPKRKVIFEITSEVWSPEILFNFWGVGYSNSMCFFSLAQMKLQLRAVNVTCWFLAFEVLKTCALGEANNDKWTVVWCPKQDTKASAVLFRNEILSKYPPWN